MLFIERSSNQIELKNDSSMFGLIGVMALAMSAFGIFIINGLLPFEDGFTFANVFGLAFTCLWTLITFSMGISAFALNSKRITVSSEGIGYRTWFKKRMFEWSEIQDWGISFSGRTRGEGNTYYLYFSKNMHKTKNEYKKKLNGDMLKFDVFEKDYSRIVDVVIPFCMKWTRVEPFVGKYKYNYKS